MEVLDPHSSFVAHESGNSSSFHWFQIVDAGFKQYFLRQHTDAARHVLIGTSRFLAAHSPTPRAVGQTFQIALRLHRGEEIYRDG